MADKDYGKLYKVINTDDEAEGVAELRAELDRLKAKIVAGIIAAQRPTPSGEEQ